MKDPYDAEYHLLISKSEGAGLKNYNDSKAFIEYPNDMSNVYRNYEEYNPNMDEKYLSYLILWSLICLEIKSFNK